MTESGGLATLLGAILSQLSLLGKLAAFFELLLVLWSLASLDPPRILAGIALLLFAVANGFWQDRYRAMIYFPIQKVRWHQTVAWSRVFLALVFFAAFLAVVYIWVRLPAVTAFLRSVGLQL